MNENLVQPSPAQPLSTERSGPAPVLWNPEAAGAWSLIFNPIFGSILVLMNWQTLGVKEKVRTSQIWLGVSVVVFLVSLFLGSTFLPLISLGYLLIWYFAEAKPQARYIRERWGKVYPRRSWLWPLLIAFALLFSLFCLGFVWGMAQEIFAQ